MRRGGSVPAEKAWSGGAAGGEAGGEASGEAALLAVTKELEE